MSTSAMASAQAAMAANAAAGQLIRQQALEMYSPLPSVTLSNTVNNAGSVVNFTPRNVGLVKGFYVEFSAQIKNGNASAAITPTGFGPSALFSNITFVDLSNNVRINCPSYQIAFLNTVKQKNPFGTAFKNSSIDNPTNYGSNTTATVQSVASTDTAWSATSSIAASGTGVITGVLWIPIAYSDHDYRGAIYANVIGGQMNLQFTVNPSPAYINGGDQMLSMYGVADSATTVQILNTTIAVNQVYMDQLPIDPKSGLAILPQRDISTLYQILNTTFTSAVPGNDFPMQYPNFRDIISSTVVFDTLGAPQSIANIANYYSLGAANTTNIFKRTGNLQNILTRNIMGFDLPTGVGYWSYRGRPLSTTQYGNLQLIFNPNSNWSSSYALYHGWEQFASIATVTQAGSLAAS